MFKNTSYNAYKKVQRWWKLVLTLVKINNVSNHQLHYIERFFSSFLRRADVVKDISIQKDAGCWKAIYRKNVIG